jgi:hypothetical protein
VWTNEGAECWVLIHVELQTTCDVDFPRRMYVYNYHGFDRYNGPVGSLVVWADHDADWLPERSAPHLVAGNTLSSPRPLQGAVYPPSSEE